ncbi:hypothetical protein A8950_2544 [Dongia mobilis]|uniref:Alpha-2-macroglobulin n=1 Tax=Dongia mobilis TaxID=578943 RepID=A0A4R6WLN1_9PROT|nr:alpha-2-macroglobulin [Dongia mobilis]TDQ81476.1 hypothetical protein A8950_2544 [Dongia mobilis]
MRNTSHMFDLVATRLRTLWRILLILAFLAPLPAAAADKIDEIAQEAATYRSQLIKDAVGGDSSRIEELNRQAADETRVGRFREAGDLLARAVGLGDESYETWMALASAHEGAQQWKLAGLAAYRAFIEVTDYQRQGDALNRVGRNFDRLGEFERALAAYDAAGRYSYDQEAYARADQLRGMLAFGLAGTQLNTDGDRPEACLEFRADLAATDVVAYEDYVRIEPATKVSYRVSGNQLCLGDLDFGGNYKVTVLRGLPSLYEDKLDRNEEWAFSVGDRNPTVGFRNQSYVLPKIGSTGIPVITVNVDTVALRLMRINDRNLVNELYEGRFLNNLEEYDRERIAQESGEEIWTGEMDVARERNKRTVTAFPFDEVVPATEPGIYILMARNAADQQDPNDYRWRWQPQATQWVIVSDLGLTTFAGIDGLTVQARSLETGRALHRLELRLLARNNEVLASTLTDTAGIARFDPGLLRGEGGRRATAIMAFRRDGDFSFLDIGGPAFDLSDRGVGGRAMPGDLDLFFYTDRGVYRPGETAQVMALSRNPTAQALPGQKLTFVLLRPDGVVSRRFTDIADTGGAYHLPIEFSTTARTGAWTVDAYLDPEGAPIASTSFLVEEVVPARIEATLTPADQDLVPPNPLPVQIEARYLYGAPAANLPVKGEVLIAADPQPFPAWTGYRFGLDDEKVDPVRLTYDAFTTDESGRLEIDMSFDEVPEAQTPLAATLRVEVYEFGGRPVIESVTKSIRDRDLYLGLKPLFADSQASQGSEAGFEVIALDREGRQVAKPDLSYRLVKEEWDYVWYYRDNRWDYDYVVSDAESSTGSVDVPADKPGRIDVRVDWGRYRLEVYDAEGGVATSQRFYAGWWAQPGSGGTPDKLQVVADKTVYGADETAEIRLTSPFAGEAQVTIATDRVVDSFPVTIPADGKTVKVKVDRAWGAGAYVLVNAFRAGNEPSQGPGRAIGLAWLGIDPAPRKLDVSMEVPSFIEPRRSVEIPVIVANLSGQSAYLTLAAVDEGVLQLTDFATPDPIGHYFGKRRLGLDIRDLYGQLIEGREGVRGQIRSGGDGEGLAKRGAPKQMKLVALFSGIVELDSSGKASIPLDVPDYNGRLRLMAVAWDADKVGAGEADLVVRDPVVALATGPRFLAPGDKGSLSVSVQNVAGAAGLYAIKLSTSQNLRLTGETTWSRELAAGAAGDWRVDLAATGIGEGHVDMAITGPENFALTRRIELPVRAAQPPVTRTITQRLQPGESMRVSPTSLADFLPETADLKLSFSATPNLDVQTVLTSLSHYPYGCVEQTTSVAFPMLFANELAERWSLKAELVKDDQQRVQDAIGRVLERQRIDGLFGLWSSYSPSDNWLSAFVMDFLTRAREQGYAVSDIAYRNGLDGLGYVVTTYYDQSASNLAARAYALYVLSRAGQGRLSELRYMADNFMDRLPSGLSLAQLGAALAIHGDNARAGLAFDAAILNANRARRPLMDYGSELRDWSGIITLMAEAGLPGYDAAAYLDKLAGLQLSRDYLSTQEQVWLLLAARATSSAATPNVSIARDNQDAVSQAKPYMLALASGELTEGTVFVNKGSDVVYAKASASGVPFADLPAQESGFRISRSFYHLDGSPADLSQVRQNDVLVVLVGGELTARHMRRTLVVDMLPAGFEIENARLSDARQTTDLSWLAELTNPVYAEYLDDRFIAALELDGDSEYRSFTLGYMVRAVTPGTFTLPAPAVEDMYAPEVQARGSRGSVTITPFR